MSPPEAIWLSAPAHAAFGPEPEVHVWRVSLAQPDALVAELANSLSPEEEFRGRQVPFSRDRRRFVTCRGLLRRLLAGYLGVPAARVAFELGVEGKPRLAGPLAESGLTFNVAHADDWTLFAVALRRPVGVDLERLRPLADVGPIAEHFFSEREQRLMAGLPEASQLDAFFNCWTRKEAVLKARGVGLAEPLGRIEVSLAPGEPARLLAVAGEPAEAARWRLVDLTPAPGYVAAVAAEGPDWVLRPFAWEP